MSNGSATSPAPVPQTVVTETTPWASAPLVTTQHSQHGMPMVESPATTTTPTARDRAYTYVMHLSVTRVRDICRALGLKQFGKKSESQPRLFWGAESLINGEESLGSWCEALPGLREWGNAPHREQSTLWRIAPPKSARPIDFHSYFAHALTARRNSSGAGGGGGSAATSSGNISVAKEEDDNEDEDTIAIAVGDTPTERDRLYTYARSLSITVVRKLCKRLGLKQFGRKRESQKRLWWHLTSPEYTSIVDDEGEVDPRADGIRWAATVTPDRWFRAPDEESRPASSGVRLRDRAVQRRKKFSANELARLIAVLVSSLEMRSRFCAMLQARRTGGGNEANFWGANVAPVFNDSSFMPRISNAVSRDPTATQNNTIEPRGGDELRRHFDRACPAFVRAYRRWSADDAKPIKFASYLRERRRSDTGAPLSPTEKRASIFFLVLKCGDEEQYTDVLQAVLHFSDGGADIKHEIELHNPPPHQQVTVGQHTQHSEQQEQQQQQLEHQSDAMRLVVAPPDPLPVAATVAPDSSHVTQVEPVVHTVTVTQTEPVVVHAPVVVSSPSPLAPTPTTQQPITTTTTTTTVDMALPAHSIGSGGQPYSTEPPTTTMAGSTNTVEVGSGDGSGGGLLGKRPRATMELLKEEIEMLKKRVNEELAPIVNMRRSVVRAQQEKELAQAIMSLRTLKKDLAGEKGEEADRLRAANAAAIERLTKDIENLSKQD